MEKDNQIIGLVLKALALAMGVAITVLTILGQFNPGMNVFTGIGLFALALSALIKES